VAQNMNVSVTLRLVDQFTSGLRQLQQNLQQFAQTAQNLNRTIGGQGANTPLGRMQQQIRTLNTDVRQLVGGFQQLGRVSSAAPGGGFAAGQAAGMRLLIQLQQQALANQARLNGGGSRGQPPGPPGGASWLGRRGFSPNASLADRGQYRAVNFLEQSLGEAILQPDIARTRLRRLDLSSETMAMAEEAAAAYSRAMPELTRGAILSTVAEIVTQFRSDNEAFQALPYLLRVQQLDIQSGRRGREGMTGMLDLLKAVGMTGRLTDADGTFTEQETANVLDAYLRAREIGGVDINPQGFRQLIKYMKASAQTLSTSAILEAALLAPDVGFSTFGNQANMLIRSFSGARATKMAQEAQARWGLRTAEIDPNHPEGPNRLRAGALVDSVLMRENPTEWVRKHVLGPQGVLRRMGIDPATAAPAAIADALAPLNSNMSAENIMLMFVQMQGELRNQMDRALRLNRGRPMFERGQIDDAAEGGIWTGLQRARARIVDSMQSIGDNLTDFVLPPLNRFADVLGKISEWTNPRTGNPAVSMGVLAGGGVGAFLLARSVIGRMGTWPRTLIGGGAGALLGGGIETALMGALMARGIGGTAAGAGAAAAGAAAGRAWGGRFVAAAGGLLRGLRSMTLWGVGTSALVGIVSNWETIQTRLIAIFGEIKAAAPTWLWGEGKGWSALGKDPQGLAAIPQDVAAYRQSWREWILGMPGAGGQWLQQHSWGQLEGAIRQRDFARMGIDLSALGEDARLRAQVPGAQAATVNVSGTTINVSVSTQPGANAPAIGEAAGNAVGSALRSVLGDVPAVP
jgi:hypothetical protein